MRHFFFENVICETKQEKYVVSGATQKLQRLKKTRCWRNLFQSLPCLVSSKQPRYFSFISVKHLPVYS